MSHVAAKFEVVGFHQWSGAPEVVHYLRDLHRHVFKFTVRVRISDQPGEDQRLVEYHQLKRFSLDVLSGFFDRNAHNEFLFGERSCEAIAAATGSALRAYRVDVEAVEVWEDDENGSCVTFPELQAELPIPLTAAKPKKEKLTVTVGKRKNPKGRSK